MKCVVCGKRKGKRHCPAKNALICAPCCGEKRVIEIACPPDCTHLASGQSYQSFKNLTAQLEGADWSARRKILATTRSFAGVIDRLENTIVSFAQGVSALRDHDVLEAVQTTLETYRTEDKGLIYEHSSPNPLAQSLSRELRESIESLRKTALEEGQAAPAAIFRDCLETMELSIQFHMEAEGPENAYITFVTRNHPEAAQPKTSTNLIQP